MSKVLHSRIGRLWDRHLGNPLEDKETGELKIGMTRRQQYVLEKSAESSWDFLTARDPETDRPLIWTMDEADKTAPLKPFPAHLEYVKEYLKILTDEPWVLVDKARQMYVTTSTMLHVHWYCLFRTGRKCMLSKTKKDDAIAILQDKVRFPHSQMPLWAQEALPINKKGLTQIKYLKTASRLIGATQNVAEKEGRGGTLSIMVVDEAARQDKYRDIVAGTVPAMIGSGKKSGGQFFAMTTPNIGTPGATAFKAELDDKEE